MNLNSGAKQPIKLKVLGEKRMIFIISKTPEEPNYTIISKKEYH
jgi:hypothetical protein